jgi:hypothetical protein
VRIIDDVNLYDLLTVGGDPVCQQQLVDRGPRLRVLVQHAFDALACLAVFYDVEVDLLRQNHTAQIVERDCALKRVAACQKLVECEAKSPHVGRRSKGVLASLLLLFVVRDLQQLGCEVLVRTSLELEVPVILSITGVRVV